MTKVIRSGLAWGVAITFLQVAIQYGLGPVAVGVGMVAVWVTLVLFLRAGRRWIFEKYKSGRNDN